MRTCVGVALVTVCLGLTGCGLFGKKQAAQTNNNPRPFLGSEAPAKAQTTALPHGNGQPLPGANGLLAGRVVDEANRHPVQAVIRVVNLEEDDAKSSELDVWTDQSGYFTIPGLKVGCHYELIARAKDGTDVLSRMVVRTPPNAAVYLEIDKRYTTAKTPPIPDAPKTPEKKSSAAAEGVQEPASAVKIGPPVKLPDQEPAPRINVTNPVPDNGGQATPAGSTAPDPASIADGGFSRVRPHETINIPSPPPLKSPSSWESAPGETQPHFAPSPPQSPGSVRLPNLPTPVPSCVLTGTHLVNFALKDIDGGIWEYRRDRRGKLLLLDFWYSTCSPCLQAIPHLRNLQQDYGSYGLQIVGIACEKGTEAQQRERLRATRSRYKINYPILLSGATFDRHSSIEEQFQVTYFPLLVLIDERGDIIWHSTHEGMSDQAHEVLRKTINNLLISQTAP